MPEIGEYFQVHYTKEKLKEYIKPDDDTLKVKLANSSLHTSCRIMLGTDKRATITRNWSEFRHRANIHEGLYLRLLFQGYRRAPPDSHRPCPLDGPSTATHAFCMHSLSS
uniref:Uncharacterized protein n=1 Tax=Triticum urartu TaxID=4572 RepID=A0A8R7REZ2_TRIUA